jgi:hypothetical protein
MISFEYVKVYNWLDALRGMRNSWESWDKMDSGYVVKAYPDKISEEFYMGPADYKLAMTLSKAGRGHDKYLRQILISVDITAPEYWWKEADTYKVGTTANSTSMMHTLGKDYTPAEAFSMEDVDHDLKTIYMELLHEAQRRWYESGKKKPSKEWRQMNQLTAISFLYRRTFTANYAVLKGMYHDRKKHRLAEWHDFADWVETLPYSELITMKEGKKNE